MSVRGEMLAPAQITALLAGEIDLALLRPPIEQSGVLVETVRRDRLLAALPEGHPLAIATNSESSDLRDEEFVAHAGHGRSVMNSVLTAMCADAGFVPRVRHEVEETSTLVTLVSAGLGVAIVPEPTAALDIAGVCYRPLAPDALGRGLGRGARGKQRTRRCIESVLAVLRQVTRADTA